MAQDYHKDFTLFSLGENRMNRTYEKLEFKALSVAGKPPTEASRNAALDKARLWLLENGFTHYASHRWDRGADRAYLHSNFQMDIEHWVKTKERVLLDTDFTVSLELNERVRVG